MSAQAYQDQLAAAIKASSGTLDLHDPGVKKNRARMEQKLADRGTTDPRILTDLVRAGATVDSPAGADRLAADLAAQFLVWDEGWKVTRSGYMDRKLMVQFPDGRLAEVQVYPTAMYEAKRNGGSALYDQERALGPVPADDPRLVAILKQSREHYRAAFDKFSDDLKAIYSAADAIGFEGGSPNRLSSRDQPSTAPPAAKPSARYPPARCSPRPRKTPRRPPSSSTAPAGRSKARLTSEECH